MFLPMMIATTSRMYLIGKPDSQQQFIYKYHSHILFTNKSSHGMMYGKNDRSFHIGHNGKSIQKRGTIP